LLLGSGIALCLFIKQFAKLQKLQQKSSVLKEEPLEAVVKVPLEEEEPMSKKYAHDVEDKEEESSSPVIKFPMPVKHFVAVKFTPEKECESIASRCKASPRNKKSNDSVPKQQTSPHVATVSPRISSRNLPAAIRTYDLEKEPQSIALRTKSSPRKAADPVPNKGSPRKASAPTAGNLEETKVKAKRQSMCTSPKTSASPKKKKAEITSPIAAGVRKSNRIRSPPARLCF
jgi:hypothetical protein